MTNKSLKKEFKKPVTTNHTSNTNKEKISFVFCIKKIYIVSSFVKFVLFVVKKSCCF